MSLLNNTHKVRIIIYKKNRQVVIKKLDSLNNSFSFDGKSYIIDKENYYMWKKLATYSYREDVPVPLSLKDLQVIKNKETIDFEKIVMSSEELDTFKRSKTAREILETINRGMPENIIGIISIFITIAGLAGVWFVLNESISAIFEQIEALSQALGV